MFKNLLAFTPVLFLTYLAKFRVLGLPTNILETYVGVLFIVWFILVIQKKIRLKNIIKQKRIAIVVGGFVLAVTLALMVTVNRLPAQHIIVPLGIWKGWIMAPIAMFVMFITVFQTREDIKKLQYILVFSVAAYSFIAVLNYYFSFLPGPAFTYDNRLVWPYFDPTTFEGSSANYPAMFIGPALISALFLWWKNKKQALLAVSIIGMLFAVFLTKSFAAWISLILTAGIGFFIMARSLKKWMIPIIVMIIGTTVFLTQTNTEKLQYALKTEGDSSTAERLRIYQVSLSFIKTDPLFGVGIGQFQKQFELQASRILQKDITRKEINHALHAHNVFLMMWLSFGILGLIAFLWLMYVLFTKNPIDLTVILVMPLIYFLIHGLFDVTYFKNDLAYEFWFLASLATIAKQLPFQTRVTVVKGMGIASKMGFPTINLQLVDGTPLPYGVYTASITTPDRKHIGVLGYGKRLTQGINQETCEIHLFDTQYFDHKTGTLTVQTKIRGWKKFRNMEQLRKAVEKDIQKAKKHHHA